MLFDKKEPKTGKGRWRKMMTGDGRKDFDPLGTKKGKKGKKKGPGLF